MIKSTVSKVGQAEFGLDAWLCHFLPLGSYSSLISLGFSELGRGIKMSKEIEVTCTLDMKRMALYLSGLPPQNPKLSLIMKKTSNKSQMRKMLQNI